MSTSPEKFNGKLEAQNTCWSIFHRSLNGNTAPLECEENSLTREREKTSKKYGRKACGHAINSRYTNWVQHAKMHLRANKTFISSQLGREIPALRSLDLAQNRL